ncbi:MAG: fibronectin type III domain-containing protein [Deltaproteobacteria bacterium]|nr:fibronectin type III domain-containing protein [Deltaproteobacteria bacterium]MCL5278201.1 fibronectin type III domain-containing protein [Deltaproteobacteria bacterium]
MKKVAYGLVGLLGFAIILMAGCSSNKSSGGSRGGTSRPAAPTNLIATPADAQVTLQWNASSGATSYNVYQSTTSGGPYSKVNATTTTDYIVTGLTNGTEYYFVVTAVNSAGDSGYSNEVGATPQASSTKPNPPTGLIAVAGNAQVSLTWNASTGATGYNIYTSTTSGTGYAKAGTTTNLDYTVTGLKNGTTYYFVITAVNAAGESGYSNQQSAIPSASQILPPTNLSALVGDTRLSLAWNTYAVGTEPFGMTIDGGGNVWVTNHLDNTVTEFNVAGAVIGTYGVGSEPLSIAIDGSGDVWVANMSSNDVTELSLSGTILATYSVGSGPHGIAVDHSGDIWVANYNDNTVSELNPSGTTIGLYQVGSGPMSIAIDASNDVWVANEFSNTVTEIGGTGVTKGTYPVGSEPYSIAVDTSNDVWAANYGDNTVTELSSSGVTIGTYPAGPTPDGIAIDASGNVWVSDWGNAVTELNGSGNPVATYAVSNHPNSIVIDTSGNVWVSQYADKTVSKLRPGVTGYNVYQSAVSGGPYTNIGFTAATGFTVAGLTDGTKYYFVVTAVNGTGESGYSNQIGATPVTTGTFTVGRRPIGISIDGNHHIWVVNDASNTVTELNSTGSVLTTVTGFNAPYAAAIDVAGNVWVTDNSNNSSGDVIALSLSGSVLTTITGLYMPTGIAIDESGNLWVANSGAGTISEVTSSSGYAASNTYTLVSWSTYPLLSGVAVDANMNVWVTNSVNGDTLSELTYPDYAAAPSSFTMGNSTEGIAIDRSGNVWIANSGDTISELTYASGYSSAHIFNVCNSPRGIAIDNAGNVWVDCYDKTINSTLIELSSTGVVEGTYVITGSNGPKGIAIDSFGNVWVTNEGTSGNYGSTVTELAGIADGPQFWPYTGPQFPGGGNW